MDRSVKEALVGDGGHRKVLENSWLEVFLGGGGISISIERC